LSKSKYGQRRHRWAPKCLGQLLVQPLKRVGFGGERRGSNLGWTKKKGWVRRRGFLARSKKGKWCEPYSLNPMGSGLNGGKGERFTRQKRGPLVKGTEFQGLSWQDTADEANKLASRERGALVVKRGRCRKQGP